MGGGAMGTRGTCMLQGGIWTWTTVAQALMCSYAQIVQLKFRNVQSKRRNCAVNC